MFTGKTSLIHNCNNNYNLYNYESTIGVDFSKKIIVEIIILINYLFGILVVKKNLIV